ncbi:hypothetical protein N431DRAFT_556656 [Stipitochalara longipes BDJ]|nr:hypothetical protein N431DRAFT_556656 [Stipitochalara longipes BDJ]
MQSIMDQEFNFREVNHLTTLSEAQAPVNQLSKHTHKSRNSAQQWASFKEEIRDIYINQDNTLATTMQMVEANHGFRASERKWKMQLKDWGFGKYVPAAQKRAREQDKETVFLNGVTQLLPERHSKRRRATEEVAPEPPSTAFDTSVFSESLALAHTEMGDTSGGIASSKPVHVIPDCISSDFGDSTKNTSSLTSDLIEFITRADLLVQRTASQLLRIRSTLDLKKRVVQMSQEKITHVERSFEHTGSDIRVLQRSLELFRNNNDFMYHTILDVVLVSFNNQLNFVAEILRLGRATLDSISSSGIPSPQAARKCILSLNSFERHCETVNKNFGLDLRYREALTIGVISFGFEDALQCRISVATILSDIQHDEEALNHLLSGFTDFISTSSQFQELAPFSTISFNGTLLQKLTSKPFLQMLDSIQKLQKKIGRDGSLDEAIALIDDIQVDIMNDCSDPCRILSKLTLLSRAYSKASMSHRADLVYEFAFPELQLQGCDEILLESMRKREDSDSKKI